MLKSAGAYGFILSSVYLSVNSNLFRRDTIDLAKGRRNSPIVLLALLTSRPAAANLFARRLLFYLI